MSTIPPIHREILVDADPQTAFEVFTARVGRWWPLEEHSVYGAGATVAFEDGRIVERSADGQAAVWGTVTRWEPPTALAFSWHPGRSAERASRVEVTFAAADGRTLVTLEHAGWEVYADPAAARAEYDQGWPVTLDRYREYAGRAADPTSRTADADGQASEDEDTWV
ncbi:MAG: SRPBCC domain-containing protein, partial [Streptosporangiaceae bacterium]